MTTHIMLVSGQAAPNLLPALDPALKPDQALLLASGKMHDKAEWLCRVFSEAGIKASIRDIADVHDYARNEEVLLEIFGELENPNDVLVNLTGGTKLMTLAAHAAASLAGTRMFYVDLDTDEVTFLDKPPVRQRLTATVRLNHYLKAYGYQTATSGGFGDLSKSQHALLGEFVLHVSEWGNAFGALNALAEGADKTGNLAAKLDGCGHVPGLDELLDLCVDEGVLSRDTDRVKFAGEADRLFCNGGWLEQHVYRTVGALKAELGISDIKCNLEVTQQGKLPVKNELDVVFMARNRLHVIECKTSRLKGANVGKSKADDILYKLDDVRQSIGGLGARGMLVSYRDMRDADLNRARSLHIEVVSSKSLRTLKDHLLRWVES